MRVTMTAENEVNVDEKPRHPDRTRDLFGVQLEVNFKKIYVKNLIFLNSRFKYLQYLSKLLNQYFSTALKKAY